MSLSSKKKSARQESSLARRYNGQVTPGSGNGWVKKNDVRTEDTSFEAKYTDKKQFALKQADLHTAERNALLDGRDSVFIVSFSGEEWAIVREEDYRRSRGTQYPFVDGDALVLGPELFAAHALLGDPEEVRIAWRGEWFMPVPQAAAEPAYDQPMLPGADRW